MNRKIVCAMSGGVDSSVAAALLKKQGFNLVGITLKLFCYARTPLHKKACCSVEAINDARRVCQKLGIPHYVVNCEKEFKKWVIDNFVAEYRAGRTPNPCVRCNQFIKFDWLIKKAKALGADYVATGHYVRIRKMPSSVSFPLSSMSFPSPLMSFPRKRESIRLFIAKDKEKDQSYFLYRLTQKQLQHVLFPLGNYTKPQVRQMAKKFGLAVYNKKGSQEVCFVENGLAGFLQKYIKARPGIVSDIGSRGLQSAKILGEHQGIWTYTIGQRASIGGHGPYYVVKVDPKKNIVWVTNKKTDPLLYRKEFCVKLFNWVPGRKPKFPLNCQVRTRYRNPLVKCTVGVAPVRARYAASRLLVQYIVLLQKPIRAITPGQSAVFYQKQEVLGGGIVI